MSFCTHLFVLCFPCLSVGEKIDSTIDPELFFQKYVVLRKPVVLTGHIKDGGWKASSDWTNSYLKEKVKGATVAVEYRKTSSGSFGRGQEENMPFNDFVDKIAGGNLLHYMTTQNLIIDEEGQPKIFGSPVTQLQGDFPWCLST